MHSHTIFAALLAGSHIVAAAVERSEPDADNTVVVREVNTVFAPPPAAREASEAAWDFPDHWGASHGLPSDWSVRERSDDQDDREHHDHHWTEKTTKTKKTKKHKPTRSRRPTHHRQSSQHPSVHPSIHPSQSTLEQDPPSASQFSQIPPPKHTKEPKHHTTLQTRSSKHQTKPAQHDVVPDSAKPTWVWQSSIGPVSSSAPRSAAAAASSSYQSTVINSHNVHRRNHSAPNIEWDAGLARTAAKIASSCKYAHNTSVDGGGYGQNIAAGIKASNIAHVITNGFYNAEVNYFVGKYGEPKPTGFEQWGHFTQVVWKKSTSVGCHTQYCPNGLQNTGGHIQPYFTVCNYRTPGNVAPNYGINVGEPLGSPTVTA